MINANILKRLFYYEKESGNFFRIKSRSGRSAGAGVIAGHNTNGYIRISICGKKYAAHRLAWLYVYGEFPKYDIDHINGNKSDNRIINLREVERYKNLQNIHKLPKNNTSGVLGVSYKKDRNKWAAQISHRNKSIYIGNFDSIDDAKNAYLKKKIEMHELYKNCDLVIKND